MNIQLQQRLDAAAVNELADQLREHVHCAGDVTLNAAAITAAGTPAVQLLVVARRSFAARSKTLRLVGGNDVLEQAFADLGLAAELDAFKESNDGEACDHGR